MKKYADPEIKIVEFDDKDIVRTSGDSGISVGGNTGIGIGTGEPPTSGS